MALTRDEVARVALLARLRLEPGELDNMARDLSQVLEHMKTLNDLDTTAVLPTFHVRPPENPWRADIEAKGLSADDALKNAPEPVESQFRVPRIVEEGA